MVENAELYDEEKELGKIIVEIRKKYDVEKIKTAKLEKNIAFLEEEKHQLTNSINKLSDELSQTTNVNIFFRHRIIKQSRLNTEISKNRWKIWST